ncbi:hypothetical protein B0A48_13977 [Cryoendolithus antarcticus]|uniref:RRM domain-containing protein n=1 Tax=Cryoendolithus antarcticus TaxID=1507870 RepID=A0A1V8SM86_9PEZI|nr:hypothetical protein B0A48_13977 [Cryoendolithus antarcticus]
MSGKLDQSLDEIMKDTKPTRGRGGRTRVQRTASGKTTAVAPVGGVAKKAKTPRGPKVATAPAVRPPMTGESKIIVNGLPEDVNEAQIKDYFSKTIGFVKRAMLTYGPNGRSRGIATIVFSNPGSASKAAQELNGVKVDNRAMKIEVIVDAKSVPAPPAPKTLGDRISKPRNAARETTKAKPAAAATGATPATNGATKSGKKKSGRGGKPKAKSADELDAEMKDYFGGNEANGAVANGEVQAVAAAVTNGGDTGMDEIS